LPYIREACLPVEPDIVDNSSYVVSFPIHHHGKSLEEVSIWEQICLAVFLQKYWSDNQVSCTVTFRPEEANSIPIALDFFKYELKSISFLPKLELGAFAQMPYEAISEKKYYDMLAEIKSIRFENIEEDSSNEKFCTNDLCTVV
jgi:ribonucleoside-triphosphate reductase (thioredoxin)